MNVKKIILISIITICGLSHAEGRQRRSQNGYVPTITPPVSENGSIYGQMSNRTRQPRNDYIRGYDKNNGEHVKSYYRSRPRR